MNLLPIFVKLDGRPVLVVGAGRVALDKIRSLLEAGAQVRVVAPAAREEVRRLAAEGRLEWLARAFEPADLDGRALAIAATDVPAVNAAVYREARARGVPANSVDDIPHCEFFFGSVVRRGALQVAISTTGESPAFAQRLKRELDSLLPAELGPWLARLGALRREVLATVPAGEPRKELLHALAEEPVNGAANLLECRPAPQRTSAGGKVFLVGAGPGDPDLLTVKALRLIESADAILHDDLVPEPILALAAPHAVLENVGKRCGTKTITQEEIQARMIERAGAGQRVVRLKSGDPLLFGRAAEEMAALRAAGVTFEVVPGVSAAFAAAAAAGASLTSRGAASSVLFTTGHHAASHDAAAVPGREAATRVVYMPGRYLRLLALEWLSEGLPGEFPCVLVSHAGQPGQQVRCTTLARLGDAEPVPAPSLLLAGWALGESAALAAATPLGASVTA